MFNVLECSIAKWERFIISGGTVDGYEFTFSCLRDDVIDVAVLFQCLVLRGYRYGLTFRSDEFM